MIIQANIANVLTIIVAILLTFFLKEIRFIPIIYLIFLSYIDIWLFKIAFEYQRITLILSRIARLNHSRYSIPKLQILMTNSTFAFFLFLQAFLTGFVIGYFLSTSIFFLIIFLILKYLFSFIIPAYIPYKKLFTNIEKELNSKNMTVPEEYIEKTRLQKYFAELPHNKEYENWAFKKYGNALLTIK